MRAEPSLDAFEKANDVVERSLAIHQEPGLLEGRATADNSAGAERAEEGAQVLGEEVHSTN